MDRDQRANSGRTHFSWGGGLDSGQAFAPDIFPSSPKMTWTLPEQIANRLAEAIIRGMHEPGARLLEIALAEQFGVSRGPIREALRILEKERLVTIRAQRGATVIKLSRKDVQDIFAVRSAMMGIVGAQIARRRDPEVFASLEAATEALERQLAIDDVDRFLAVIYHVSMFFVDCGENALARQILFSVGRQTLTFTRKALTIARNRQNWVRYWKRIVKTVRNGDPEVAERAARDLVDMVGRIAIATMETPAQHADRQNANV